MDFYTDVLSNQRSLIPLKCNITDNKDRYSHWDKLRFLPPPEGHSSEQWWAAIKHARRQMYKHITINDPNGKPFVL